MDLSDSGSDSSSATNVLTRPEVDDGHQPEVPDPPVDASGGHQGSTTLAAIVVAMLVESVYRRGAFYPLRCVRRGGGVGGHRSHQPGPVQRSRFECRCRDGRGTGPVVVRSLHCGAPAGGLLATGRFVPGLRRRVRRHQGARRTGPARIAMALVATAAAVAVIGLVGIMWRISALAEPSHGFWQLASPLTHPSAAAGLLGISLVLALALDLRAALPRMAVCVIVAGFIGTQSHWTLLALACGAVFVPARRWAAAWWPLAMGVLAGVVTVASASGHLARWASVVLLLVVIAGAALQPRSRRGRSGAVALAVLLVVVALATTILLLRPPASLDPSCRRTRARHWPGLPTPSRGVLRSLPGWPHP